ncbi:MAG: putative two-component system sensor histidine kinase [Phycisphaerales bacterium]|nr:putative two-component system sensor histidine kinase [Phycisphaerales bacterium]
METENSTQFDHAAAIRSWESRAPWFRRALARAGLQGKLIFCFLVVLMATLGGSFWLLSRQGRAVFDRVAAEHAAEMARALGLASQTPLERKDVHELSRVAGDLLKHRDVSVVAFYDASGALLTVASQDPDLDPTFLPDPKKHTQDLMQPFHGSLPALGRYVRISAPVITFVPGPPDGGAGGGGSRVAGYVTVCLSQTDTDGALHRGRVSVGAFNLLVMLASVPLVYMLVHRIFSPIRELVAAADKIAAGDLETEVAIHRPDAIGTLARSLNGMVRRVRTQQKELEEANRQLAEANRDLEQNVQQRTSQLEAANKRLSSEIAEKEDFLRAVSHDLNAPLRNISGMASMLLLKNRGAFDDEIIHRLERIQKNVEVETGLISELLELSRIKTRRQRTEDVEIGELVREIAGMFEGDLGANGIRFVVDSTLPVLHCERSRLRQVFQNLIDNAIKYMGDGSRRPGEASARKEIHVGCLAHNDEAEFYVEDTGVGIEEDERDKVFYVFRRGRKAAVSGIPGKGVGLASVKSIVETYNGTIWVESEVGRGSTFRFTVNGKFVAKKTANELVVAG